MDLLANKDIRFIRELIETSLTHVRNVLKVICFWGYIVKCIMYKAIGLKNVYIVKPLSMLGSGKWIIDIGRFDTEMGLGPFQPRRMDWRFKKFKWWKVYYVWIEIVGYSFLIVDSSVDVRIKCIQSKVHFLISQS